MAAGFELHSEWLREIRFPYLDRDLLEFTYAVPQEQNVRVGQRRSLMKRALVGIVPVEILNRRRMAFIPLEPKEQGEKKQTLAKWPSLAEIGQHIIGSSIGIIDPNRFWEALEKARLNEKVPIANLNFTLKLESWLRHLTIQGVLTDSMRTERQDCPLPVEAKERQVPACTKVSVS